MFKQERQTKILQIVQAEGKAEAKALSGRLRVSEDTIRRDLREMDKKGWIQRVHGGAFPIHSGPLTFSDRDEEVPEEKVILAKKGAEFINDGQFIILDGSTTNLQLINRLPKNLRATIITNSIVNSLKLSVFPNIEVITLGGRLFKDSLVNVGGAVIDALRTVKADLCFLGVYSIHPDFGLSVPDYEESLVKKQMIRSANKTIALLTKNKLNTISRYSIEHINRLDYLIVSQGVPEQALAAYLHAGIEIIRAK